MCAAHCKQSSNNFTAGAGSVSLNGQRQTQRISSQAAHPQYNSRLIDYDYMVITTQGTWNYDQYVAPIKIVNPSTSELPNGTACQTSGYGYSQHIGGQPGKLLSKMSESNLTQVLSPPPCNGPTSTASPSLSARRSGAHRPSPLANSAPPPMASPHAWVTPADH